VDTSPHTPQEIRRWAHERRPREREPLPQAGERLLIRETDFGEPVPAVVTAVMDLGSPHDHWNRHGGLEHERGPGEPDANVWRYDEASGAHVLRDDPWPWAQVSKVVTAGDGSEELAYPRWCREARVRGSAGWLRAGSRAHTGNYESRE
jgi:hypothetical protein